jgi:membrane-associated phospholipid phosphatase
MSSRQLLARSSLILAVCAALVVVCYFFVDRPVASFVYREGFRRYVWLKWLTYAAEALEPLGLLVLLLTGLKAAWRPLTRFETALLAAAVNLLLTLTLKEYLKFAFGRYWPTTWVGDNPSFIDNDAYGFHPFHRGAAYDSFPSGHTARIVAVVSVLWLAYPRWRWACGLAVAAVVVGLVGMNYHFVGDCVGGAGLGAITGLYTAALFRLTTPAPRKTDQST